MKVRNSRALAEQRLKFKYFRRLLFLLFIHSRLLFKGFVPNIIVKLLLKHPKNARFLCEYLQTGGRKRWKKNVLTEKYVLVKKYHEGKYYDLHQTLVWTSNKHNMVRNKYPTYTNIDKDTPIFLNSANNFSLRVQLPTNNRQLYREHGRGGSETLWTSLARRDDICCKSPIRQIPNCISNDFITTVYMLYLFICPLGLSQRRHSTFYDLDGT